MVSDFQQRCQEHTMEKKTVSPTNCAGKTGYAHVQNEMEHVSDIVCKKSTKMN